MTSDQKEAERPKFEAWFNSRFPEAPEIELERYADGDREFKRTWTWYAWEGWLAKTDVVLLEIANQADTA